MEEAGIRFCGISFRGTGASFIMGDVRVFSTEGHSKMQESLSDVNTSKLFPVAHYYYSSLPCKMAASKNVLAMIW